MRLTVYQGEVFERPTWRYAVFIACLSIIFLLGLFGGVLAKGGDGSVLTISNIINSLILLMLIGGYRRYTMRADQQLTTLEIQEQGIVDNGQLRGRGEISGFVLEVDLAANRIKNIVLLFSKSHHIHTIHDTQEQLQQFVEVLETSIPRLGSYPQSALEKVARKFKL